MTDYPRPVLFTSRCIEFEACRWNAVKISCPFVRQLKAHADFITLCPESDIGLGVPRDPVRIIDSEQGERLYQPASGRDYTREMQDYCAREIPLLAQVDGCILKEKSPSCGNREVKLYSGSSDKAMVKGKTTGLFAAALLKAWPDVPTENEGRLNNFTIREHFYTAVFTRAEFRLVRKAQSPAALVDFQTRHKLLFMANNQSVMREMGRLVANHQKRPIAEILVEYHTLLGRMFDKLPRRGSHVNVLMHALGYFSKELRDAERAHFLEVLQRFQGGKLPLSACTALLDSWIRRFEEPWLARQSYFAPYPRDLIDISDSGRGSGSNRD